MITCHIDEVNTIKFDLAATGVSSDFDVYFTVVNNTSRFSFAAAKSAEHSYSVDVPALNGMMSEGSYNCEINVIIGTKIFTPFTRMITFIGAASVPAIESVSVNDTEIVEQSVTSEPGEALIIDTPVSEVTPEPVIEKKKPAANFSIVKQLAEQAEKTPAKINMMAEINSIISGPKVKKPETKIVESAAKSENIAPGLKITRAEVIVK